MAGGPDRPRGVAGIPLTARNGVIGVLLLLAIVFVTAQGRFGEGTEIGRIDDPLEAVAVMPLAPAGAAGPPGAADSRERPLAFAERVTADVNRRWDAAIGGGVWRDMDQPLTARVAQDLSRVAAPDGLVLTYGVARVAAAEVQRQLGIREAVSRAAEDDPPTREALARRLRLQAICLAGVYLGSAYGPDRITDEAVRRALDAGLVQGTRSGAEDAWLRRGARSGRAADCAAFRDG